ncbi:hypothetical protein JHK84_028004 [Glycine max]|nr:hypothetical protein JHK85_028410 [Glycine max]KAG5003748.1 hypothetical protein JHK86_027887 [Glycine max]KAG5151532.1 hypothetical protein JHK84_028004 [Glycine max]
MNDLLIRTSKVLLFIFSFKQNYNFKILIKALDCLREGEEIPNPYSFSLSHTSKTTKSSDIVPDLQNTMYAFIDGYPCGFNLQHNMEVKLVGGSNYLTLTKRSFVNMCRDVGYYWLNGYYGVAAYILANFLSSFPFLVLIALTSCTIMYNMVKFRPGINHFVFFFLNIYSCISVIESLMIVVASLVPNFLMGIITGAGIIGIMMMTSGFFTLLSDLPKPVWRYPYLYISYGSCLLGQYRVRFHYGHPDVFDRILHITRGGISKASCGINLSKDIFAGTILGTSFCD